jgi:hypothetical protein
VIIVYLALIGGSLMWLGSWLWEYGKRKHVTEVALTFGWLGFVVLAIDFVLAIATGLQWVGL